MPGTEPSPLLRSKPGLIVHADAALNAETPPHLLDARLTSCSAFFVRNNGALPSVASHDPATWTLTIDGEVDRAFELTVADLERRFEVVSLESVLECAGNGRAGFTSPTDGVQWGFGAVGCARWTGVRMGDVLREAGIRPGAMYTAHHSPDRATDGAEGPALSRGLPLAKALAPETLLAFAMNEAPLDFLHGAPLRVVAPGYPGSAWQKWLTRISVLDHEHDGVKMTGTDYRLPQPPLRPGEPWDGRRFEVITDMQIRALVTRPAAGFRAPLGLPLAIAGYAWGGHTPPVGVDVSIDGGSSWHPAALEPAPNEMPFGWRRFQVELTPTRTEDMEILARATDQQGRSQPLHSAPWNPRGYCNNGIQRVPGRVVG